MAAKKKSAFADAQNAIIKAFHQLEHSLMGTAPVKKAAKPSRKKAKKKAAKKSKKQTRK